MQQQQSLQNTHSSILRKEDWNNSDNSNHSQIAISTQRGDFLVEQIKNGAGGEQSTYFLSPINSNKVLSSLHRESNATLDFIGIYFILYVFLSYLRNQVKTSDLNMFCLIIHHDCL